MRKPLIWGLLLVTMGCSGPTAQQEPGSVVSAASGTTTQETELTT